MFFKNFIIIKNNVYLTYGTEYFKSSKMSMLKVRSFSELAKSAKSLAVIQIKFRSSLVKKDGDVITHTGQVRIFVLYVLSVFEIIK